MSDRLTFNDNDKAIKPPVFISFSLRSILTSLGLSAMYSAKATAPKIRIYKTIEKQGVVTLISESYYILPSDTGGGNNKRKIPGYVSCVT